MPLEPNAGFEPTGSSGGGRSRGKVIVAAVGAAAIIAAGVFAITRFAGDDASAGGAESPEAAGNAFLDALDNEDILGVVDVLLPGEAATFRQPIQDMASELQRLEVVSDDNLLDISGIDITITDREVRAEETNVDDIVNLDITAEVGGSIDGEQLPIGDWIRDNIDADELAELDEDAPPEQSDLELTAVEHDGRWYISAFYSAAEQARHDAGDPDIPAEGVRLNGGQTPEAAIDAMLTAATELDLAGIIGALNPNEFEALQRYAALFLDDAQDELDVADVTIDMGESEYEVHGSGDRRSVELSALSFDITAEGETVGVELADGCYTVSAQGEETSACVGEVADLTALDEMIDDPDASQKIRDVIDSVQDAMAEYEAPGLVVEKVGDAWYLSPMATASDNLLALTRAFTREELEDLWDQIDDLVQWFEERSSEDYVEMDEYDLPDDYDVPDEVTPSTVPGVGEGELEEGTAPASTNPSDDSDPVDKCYAIDEAADAATCFQTLVDSGQIDSVEVPWFLAHPECGAADAVWADGYYTLADAEFVAFVDQIAPCFQNLVATGALQDYEVPAELMRPECLEGRNHYISEDEPYLVRFEDCAYR